MAPSDPLEQTPRASDHEPPPSGEHEPPPSGEPLVELGERLRRATEAAERLAADAVGGQAGRETGDRAPPAPPPAGWQADADPRETDPNVQALATLLETARGLAPHVPPDLAQRLAVALRELLLALRALIDWYLERSERGPAEPVEVEDIPIL